MKQEGIQSSFEAFCNEITENYQIPALALGLAKDGELFYEKKIGYRDTEKGLPLTSNTVFGIGSITKSFTAIAILQLQEIGKLSIHDPVLNYIPELKTPRAEYTKKMTIHHLLTHSSGLPSLPLLFGALRKSMEKDPKFGDEGQIPANFPYINTYEDFLTSLGNLEYTLLGEPGTEYTYSNDGYSLLGLIIERVSGFPYEEYIKDHILKPADMHHSGFHYEDLQGHEDIAVLYDVKQKDGETIVFRSNNPWDAPPMRASGFLKSTVKDMLRYTEIYRNDGKVGDAQILSPESVELMMTPHIQCDYRSYYGYGLKIIPDYFGHKLLQHGGDLKGVAAQINILPEIGLAGIALANLGAVPSSKVLFNAFADYLDQPLNASYLNVTAKELPIEALQEYTGEFVSSEGIKVTFTIVDNKLQADAPGLLKDNVQAIDKDWFLAHMREDEITFHFIRDNAGKIDRVAFAERQLLKA
ncbi:beta-lactamase family protein [Lederbergia sp. NSJ-179]|uniref:serine hydrolase domain-containing protein n=1 Tax=Lederbergia sp. NSJ-179 TaxID=2931402 RepID=UPI001FD5FBA1|nr:serine hydrolase domain-containing protein [Lederbergia sp. NSJ-179]MCJ7842103.1 beta-lactamase family protein [Lederbergia sp. NSJ-179]